jgi:5-hydroxyisourate hydrolase
VTISTHVLDARNGRPAAGVSVLLERQAPGAEAVWAPVETGQTDTGGRLRLSCPAEPGVYRITFGTGGYFAAEGVTTFYPRVEVAFEVTSAAEHYHVPLLLSPFAYSTYRGS